MTEVVLLERPAEGVVLLRINRPEARNALNTEVRRLIARHMQELGEDTTTRAIVLAGNEKSFAAGADIMSPVSTYFIALYLPTARARRWVPPPPGRMPIFTSGWPKRADSPATMMSQVIASSQPPPSA